MKTFDSMDALRRWLENNGVDLTLWGRGNAKTLQNLWHELLERDAAIQEAPPLRLVDVVQIIIRRHGQILVETVQEFSNGQRRFRNRPPAEKIKPGESYLDAARRCLAEELGIPAANVTFDESTHRQWQRTRESPSYPGLLTQYTFHTIEAAAPELPEADFWRENISASESDPVKRHCWSWQTAVKE